MDNHGLLAVVEALQSCRDGPGVNDERWLVLDQPPLCRCQCAWGLCQRDQAWPTCSVIAPRRAVAWCSAAGPRPRSCFGCAIGRDFRGEAAPTPACRVASDRNLAGHPWVQRPRTL